MIRQRLAASVAGEMHFQPRGGEATRLEHFSDAVFAFAVTLLVVSLEVPKTFPELVTALRGFVAFGVCFAILVLLWLFHCRFFRRYGLHDGWATFLNSVLLFFVLFYVYPLKFLASAMLAGMDQINVHDTRMIFVIYGAGCAAVFLTFASMYLHAWSRRDDLALTDFERLRTRHVLINHLAMGVVGLGSVLLALVLPERHVGLAGYFYFVVALYFTAAALLFKRRERRLIRGITAPTTRAPA